MAEEEKKKPKKGEEPAASVGSSSNKTLVIIIVVLVALLVIGGAVVTTMFIMMKQNDTPNIEEIDPSLQIDVEHPIKKVPRSERDPKEMGFEKKGLALYYTIEPTFLVALTNQDRRRYLKVDVSVMARNPNTIEAIKRHEPLIKNDLLALFSAQSREALIKASGKEDIQKQAKRIINGVIGEHSDAPEIEEVLFINFLVQ